MYSELNVYYGMQLRFLRSVAITSASGLLEVNFSHFFTTQTTLRAALSNFGQLEVFGTSNV